MASFTSFFYDLFFGSNWSKSYCEDPKKKLESANIAAAVLPLTSVPQPNIAAAVLPLAVPQPNIAAAVLPLATNAAVEPAAADLAPELLPLISSTTFKRRRLGERN